MQPNQATRLLPSVLDRLLDPNTMGTKMQQGYSTEEMQAKVKRDLNDLLNARRPPRELLEDLPEVSRSVFAFGLPDLKDYQSLSPEAISALCTEIEQIISQFEPRLIHVKVTPKTSQENTKFGKLDFEISATLNVNPFPPVIFNTMLDVAKDHLEVR